MRHFVNELREGNMPAIRAQPLWLPESAVHMDCFSLPRQYFQHPKGKKMATDSCFFKK